MLMNVYAYPYPYRHNHKGVILLGNDILYNDGKYGVCIFLEQETPYKLHMPHLVPACLCDLFDKDPSLVLGTVSRAYVIQVIKNVLQNWWYWDHYLCPDKNRFMRRYLQTRLDEVMEEEAACRYTQKCAQKICNALYDAYSNPYNPICKKRLMREYSELHKDI